jgi:multiple sugar transport system permease protein
MSTASVEAVRGGAKLAALRRRVSGKLAPYVLVAPAMLAVLVVAVVPLGYGIYLSFTDWSLLSSSSAHLTGLDTWRELLHDARFRQALVHTVWWTVGTLIVEFGLGLPIALLLHRRTPVTGVVTGLLMLPWVTPFVVVAYAWQYLLDSSVGPVHAVLEPTGVVGEVSPFADPARALITITAISGWKGLPFMVVAILAARKGISDDVYEAAALDGATPWQSFRHITLPLLTPTLAVVGVVLGVLAFYSFDLVWLLTQGGPGDSTNLVGIELYTGFFRELRPGYAATMGTLLLVLLAVPSLLIVRLTRRARAAG